MNKLKYKFAPSRISIPPGNFCFDGQISDGHEGLVLFNQRVNFMDAPVGEKCANGSCVLSRLAPTKAT